MAKCWLCESKETERQICGFWFCWSCLPRALAAGAAYWRALYLSLYPWR
jgi:ribosomal protein L37AE/L43A